MFLKILLLTWILKLKAAELRSSLVVDKARQKGIYLDEYCPRNPYCDEGTHVMCMYYDASREYGPHCVDPRNISVTAEQATKFLDVTNAMRARLAMGNEVGSGNEPLPRAYGMFKLQWDNELATFAQVLANQCLVRHDMCRGSKKFPSPGQTVGLIRFTSPDWFPAKTKNSVLKEPGLTDEKIMYAVTTAMSSWYSHKKAVTADMIGTYPDWSHLDAGKDNGRLYLDTVYGPATHMGCGISAFSYYTYYDDKSKLVYNVILVVCNYSEAPLREKSVYDVERRAKSSQCGCPLNALEDENCLCSYLDEQTPEAHCDEGDCEQTVILLPIFTVEDAPPSKQIVGRQIKQQSRLSDSMEIVGAEFPGNKTSTRSLTIAKNEHSIVKVLNGIMNNEQLGKPVQQSSRAINRRRDKSTVSIATNLYHKQAPFSSSGHVQPKKTSIFSRSVLFATSKPNTPWKLTLKDVKKRKDFSKAKRLVNTYMEAVKNYTILKYKIHIPEPQDKLSTDTLNKAENDVIIYDSANDTFHVKHNEIENTEGDGDTKLMTLLDKLEEEVQHIELSGNKKELFDAKIRKIYDSVVGNPSGLPEPKTKHHIELEHGISGAIEKVIDRTSREIETKRNEKERHIDDKFFDIGKTIDEMVHNHHDEAHRISLDEVNDGPKKRRTRVKSRVDDGYILDRDFGTDYELRKRENAKIHLRTEKIPSYDPDKQHKPYTFPEHRQSYKSKDQEGSYESFKMRYNTDEVGRRDKRLKHIRDYFKSRSINSVENLRNKHYTMHRIPDDIDDDVISPARRKYYQDKLDNLKRKLYSTRIHKYRNEVIQDTDHRRRALRLPSNDDEAPRRPSKSHLEHFDMRERSRFIHAY